MNTKTLLQSKTVRGIIITFSVSITNLLGIDMIVTDEPGLIEGMIQIVGLLISLFGRIDATKNIVLFENK